MGSDGDMLLLTLVAAFVRHGLKPLVEDVAAGLAFVAIESQCDEANLGRLTVRNTLAAQ